MQLSTLVNRNGFTLLEVMIAVAIFAIALTTLLGAQSQSLTIVTDARFDTMAAFLAQEKLTDLRGTNFDDIYTDSGTFDEDFSTYSWNLEVSEPTEEDIGAEVIDGMLKHLILRIALENDATRTFVVQTTLMKRIPPHEQDGQ